MKQSENIAVKSMPMNEIHELIGFSLQKELSDFAYSKSRKQSERKNNLKTDVISWNCGKYGDKLHLSFCGLIRHNKIDSLYEELFQISKGKEYAVWDSFNELGDTKESTQYHALTKTDLNAIVEQVVLFMKTRGLLFFDKITDDEQFFRYLCIEKNIESYSAVFALKRIMFCCLFDRSYLSEVHKYNLECCESAPSGTNFYTKQYLMGLEILENYYGNLEIF